MLKSILLKCMYALMLFIAPIQGLLILLLLSVVIDTLFAVYAVWKTDGHQAIRSHKLFNIVVKVFLYFGAVIMLYMADLHIFGALFGVSYLLSKSVALIFLFIEIKSMDETSVKIGNKSVWDIISELVKKIAGLKKDLSDIKE